MGLKIHHRRIGHHVRIHVGHDEDGADHHQQHDEHAEGECQHVVGVVGAARDVKEENQVNAHLRNGEDDQAGGMVAQLLAMLTLVPPLSAVSLGIMVPTIAALLLVSWFGSETRGRDLRDLDPDGHTFAATGM